MMYSATTHRIRVTALPHYLAAESRPQDDFFVWSYQIRVENLSEVTVQLLNRHWELTDANGVKQIIDGAGVIGQQPVIAPGEGFEYTSWTQLHTPSGLMHGYYELATETQQNIIIVIPVFSLDSPMALQLAN